MRAPTTLTILLNDDPNHLGLRCNALRAHQMALITSVCAPVRTPNEILDYFNIKKDATWEEEQELIATHKVRPQSPPPNIDCPMFEWPGSPRVFPREQERLEMGGAEVEQRQGRQARESTEQSR